MGFRTRVQFPSSPYIGILDLNVEGMYCWISNISKIALHYMKNIAGLFLKVRMLNLSANLYRE